MKLTSLLWSGCVSLAMAAYAVPAVAAVAHKCVPGKPTAASYTWNFKAEANNIFREVQNDTQRALYHAEKLKSFAPEGGPTWQVHAEQLQDLRNNINDMGAKLCRLETIRRVVAPWQQQEIDRMATTVRLMADNAQDAIRFVNTRQSDLWLGTYQKYLANLDHEAQSLTRSVGDAVQYAGVTKEYRDLRQDMGSRTAS